MESLSSLRAPCRAPAWRRRALAAEDERACRRDPEAAALRSVFIALHASAQSARGVLDTIALPFLADLNLVDESVHGGLRRRHACRVVGWLCAHAALHTRPSCAEWMVDTLSGGDDACRLGMTRFVSRALAANALGAADDARAPIPRAWRPAARSAASWGVDSIVLAHTLVACAAELAAQGAPSRLASESLVCAVLLVSDIAQRGAAERSAAATGGGAAAAIWTLCTDGAEPVVEAILLHARRRAARTDALVRAGIDDILLSLQRLCRVGWEIAPASSRQRAKLAARECEGEISVEERRAVEERAAAADASALRQVQRALAWTWSSAAPALIGAERLCCERGRRALRRNRAARRAGVAGSIAMLAQDQFGGDGAVPMDVRRAQMRSLALWLGGASRVARERSAREHAIELCAVATAQLRAVERAGEDGAVVVEAREACDDLAVALLRQVLAAHCAEDAAPAERVAGLSAVGTAMLGVVAAPRAITPGAAALAAEVALRHRDTTLTSLLALTGSHGANARVVIGALSALLDPERAGELALLSGFSCAWRTKEEVMERIASVTLERAHEDNGAFVRFGASCVFGHPLVSATWLLPRLVDAAASDAPRVRAAGAAALRATLMMPCTAPRLVGAIEALVHACGRGGGVASRAEPAKCTSPSSLAAMMDAAHSAAGGDEHAASGDVSQAPALSTRHVVPLLHALLRDAVVAHAEQTRRALWPGVVRAITTTCLSAPRNLTFVKIFRTLAPLMARGVDACADAAAVGSVVWPTLLAKLASQRELNETTLLRSERSGDEGSAALEDVLFDRLSPLLLIKLLPLRMFVVVAESDASTAAGARSGCALRTGAEVLIAHLWRRMARAYEFAEVRRAAAEALARLPFDTVARFTALSLARFDVNSGAEEAAGAPTLSDAWAELSLVVDDVPVEESEGGTSIVELVPAPAALVSRAMQAKLAVYSLLQALLAHVDPASGGVATIDAIASEVPSIVRVLMRTLAVSLREVANPPSDDEHKLQRGCIDCLAYILRLAVVVELALLRAAPRGAGEKVLTPAPTLRGLLALLLAHISRGTDNAQREVRSERAPSEALCVCYANVVIRSVDMHAGAGESTEKEQRGGGDVGAAQRLLLQRVVSAPAFLDIAAGAVLRSPRVQSAHLHILVRLSYPTVATASGERGYTALPPALRLQRLADIALAAAGSSDGTDGRGRDEVVRCGVRLLGSLLGHLAVGDHSDVGVVDDATLETVTQALRRAAQRGDDTKTAELAAKLLSSLL